MEESGIMSLLCSDVVGFVLSCVCCVVRFRFVCSLEIRWRLFLRAFFGVCRASERARVSTEIFLCDP